MHHLWGAPSAGEEAAVLWRYYPTDRLLQVLRSSSLYFSAATQFDDAYEGAMRVVSAGLTGFPTSSQAAAFNAFFGNTRSRYKISCWHEAESENSLMWQAYASRGNGVAIRTTLDRVVRAVKPYRLGQGPLNDVFWCGRVKYRDLTEERVPPNAEPPVGTVKRFFFKHDAFAPEREFRLLADLHNYTGAVGDPTPPALGVLVEVELNVLIEAVLIGPTVSQQDAESIAEAAARCGLADRIRESTLRQTPRFL